jgi:hypothetical protein
VRIRRATIPTATPSVKRKSKLAGCGLLGYYSLFRE